ncbi:beta-carotene 15,15'-monooxygenase [Chryseobacterium sp.]|uniref:beta-carotene 15,15'-monooxygenase n=1 Tax=Chryseobacterium sp. TaxID=1871047 RepID=UPI0025C59C30|nr:beta-carotene 15,15'-monooxygenase [Chryseobacterium sp.]
MPIKNLFRLKSATIESQPEEPQKKETDSDPESSEEIRKRTYHETGFRDSSRNHGNHATLSICLHAIYSKFQNEEKEMVDKQNKLKEAYINEQQNKFTEVKALTVSIENKGDRLKEINAEIETFQHAIEELKAEINDLPRNPEKYNVNATKGASTKFWIGLLLLIPISLYLFTFYISTSYSAFFKNYNINSDIIPNILDAQAFSKAWVDGPIEGAFVTLIPFVFLGLGYLIHMFGENKSWGNYCKIAFLFLITFVFDVILAYAIEARIFELERVSSSEQFNLYIAFTRYKFWGIIFAGFVVYIIWGLVFDFVMKEHREKDKIKNEQTIRQKSILFLQEKINSLKQKTEDIKNSIESSKEFIIQAKGRIEELQTIIDGVIIPTKDYKLYASEYVQGWITYIGEKIAIAKSEKQLMIEECIEQYNLNLESVGAHTNNQNSVYLSEL